ncbi:MAG TPA: pyridoxal phosphate-dependent aminotransferase [Rubricoccaceae bacterium]|nr:pyridoxal phosphate-dependent aminotransferase [Rubricoccaceae bacterium]
MKPLASRTDALRQSDIRAVTFAVNRVGGINLGQGICDLATPDPIKIGAVAAVEGDRSIYTPYNGVKALREGILEKARAFNGLPAEDDEEVMVSVGSTGAFVAAVLALCEPGDEVVLFEPFYGYHTGLLGLLGVRPVAVPLRAPDWAVDFGALEAAITERTKAVLVCTPANPSGKVWTEGELTRLLALLEKHDLWAVTDEIYEYMTYDGHRHVSLGSLPGAYERTVTLSGFSKTFNMTGWRLGYAVAAPPVIEKMGLISDLVYICAPAPLQHGVAAALPMPEDYYTRMQADYTAKRALMCDTLEACGFTVHRPDGAYYVLANFEALARERGGFADDRAATNTLIERAGVACVPGNSFFADPEDGRYWLRFCYAKEMDVLEDACRRLRAAFEAVPAGR